MKVKELILKLQKLPKESEVMFSESSSCSECNEESMDIYHYIYSVVFKEEDDYPNKEKNIVVIS